MVLCKTSIVNVYRIGLLCINCFVSVLATVVYICQCPQVHLFVCNLVGLVYVSVMLYVYIVVLHNYQ